MFQNRDGSVGKPRRSLATQFDLQPPGNILCGTCLW